MSSAPLILAIGRGRALDGAKPMLKRMGFALPEPCPGRALSYDIDEGLSMQVLRNWDVPVYVSEGAADVGIVGNDILAEHPEMDLYAPVDLCFSQCRLAIATPEGSALPARPRIATRHLHSTREWFQGRGHSLHLIHLYGSLESAPARGLADGICDLVATGRSLQENNLGEVATLMQVSARLIVNKAAARSRMVDIDRLVQRFSDAVEAS